MSKSLEIKFDTSGIEGALNAIEEGAAVNLRPAAQAGAQVFYEEVVLLAPEGKKEEHIFYIRGKKYGPFARGTLKRSIYQVFSEKNSSRTQATYHISWNHKKAPYGHMVEDGTARAAAHSFVRPAYDNMSDAALKKADAHWTEDMKALLARVK